MNVWREFWQKRCFQSYAIADRASRLIHLILDDFGPTIVEWGPAQEALRDWQPLRLYNLGDGDAGFWSPRAEAVEQAADRFALVLEALRSHHDLSRSVAGWTEDLMRDWMEVRERRYAALPAGETKIGNLSSGGIDV